MRDSDSMSVQLDRPLKFHGSQSFHQEVRKRVEVYFRESGRRKRDCPAMYVKSAIIMSCFALSWTLLVFFAEAWWQALPLALMLSASIAAIGFNIEHDGGHNAYSKRRWVNQLSAMSLDLVGASSYVWRWKHAVLHHSYVNIKGHDADIELGGLGRLSPHTGHRWYYRWQHFYLWPLYGVLIMKWHVFDDFRDILIGRVGARSLPRPKGWSLVFFLGGKAVCFSLFLLIPLLYHPLGVVLVYYVLVFSIVGLLLSVVFQLAHCVEPASFTRPEDDTGVIEKDWGIHQVESTVNFARGSRIATWCLGGLNYQIEHHLFPTICHINYPRIAGIVRQTCEEFGVRYNEFSTVAEGVASHYRWLRRMGAPA